ncbi:MAG: FeoB-associated Cys-rich membrane protein [Pyrinomonadaceae bacterium]
MRLDWQTIAVSLIILAACLYVARRAFARLRSFGKSGRGGAATCETGCGSCGSASQKTTKPAPTFVQISPARTPPRQSSTR